MCTQISVSAARLLLPCWVSDLLPTWQSTVLAAVTGSTLCLAATACNQAAAWLITARLPAIIGKPLLCSCKAQSLSQLAVLQGLLTARTKAYKSKLYSSHHNRCTPGIAKHTLYFFRVQLCASRQFENPLIAGSGDVIKGRNDSHCHCSAAAAAAAACCAPTRLAWPRGHRPADAELAAAPEPTLQRLLSPL